MSLAFGASGGGTNNPQPGQAGKALTFTIVGLPLYLQGGGSICYPELSVSMVTPNLNR